MNPNEDILVGITEGVIGDDLEKEGVIEDEGEGTMQEITVTEPAGPFALATVLLPINDPTVDVTPRAVLTYELPPPPLP